MHVVILTFGTRGEVHPLIALGLGLQAVGHTVRFVTQTLFVDFVRQYGLDCVGVSLDLREIQKERGKGGYFSFLGLFRLAIEYMQRDLARIWEASQDAEAIIACGIGITPAWHLAEKLSIPLFATFLYPVKICNTAANPGITGAFRLGFEGILYGTLSKFVFRPFLNAWRKHDLGLRPVAYGTINEIDLNCAQVPILYAFSPTVLPKPATWPESNYITGYWFLEHTSVWLPPKELVDFLEAGPPPVCIGFSSAEDKTMQGLDALVLEALALAGQRGILTAGWSDLGHDLILPDTVLGHITYIPHTWIFPQAAAAIHHGGAGTSGVAFRAGIPNIILPIGFDTHLWAKRNVELGVGPPELVLEKLTAAQLAETLSQTLNDTTMQAQRMALSEQIRLETGVAHAIEIFHRYTA